MRALVTGATGFLGTHLVLELRRQRWDVVCAIRTPRTPSDNSIRCVPGDLLRPESLSFDEPEGSIDTLFHFAAQLPTQGTTAQQFLMANGLSTLKLLDLASALGIRSVVYASSLPVIGTPRSSPITEDHTTQPRHPYHVSKLWGELACEMARQEGRSVSSLRISSPYGAGMPNHGVLARFVTRALKSEKLEWFGSGSRAQNFVHVSDVVRAAISAAQTPTPGVYNIGGAEATTMRDLANLVVRLTPGTRSAAGPASSVDPEEGIRWDVDISKAGSGLGYKPQVTTEEGVRDYIQWVKSGAVFERWWNK